MFSEWVLYLKWLQAHERLFQTRLANDPDQLSIDISIIDQLTERRKQAYRLFQRVECVEYALSQQVYQCYRSLLAIEKVMRSSAKLWTHLEADFSALIINRIILAAIELYEADLFPKNLTEQGLGVKHVNSAKSVWGLTFSLYVNSHFFVGKVKSTAEQYSTDIQLFMVEYRIRQVLNQVRFQLEELRQHPTKNHVDVTKEVFSSEIKHIACDQRKAQFQREADYLFSLLEKKSRGEMLSLSSNLAQRFSTPNPDYEATFEKTFLRAELAYYHFNESKLMDKPDRWVEKVLCINVDSIAWYDTVLRTFNVIDFQRANYFINALNLSSVYVVGVTNRDCDDKQQVSYTARAMVANLESQFKKPIFNSLFYTGSNPVAAVLNHLHLSYLYTDVSRTKRDLVFVDDLVENCKLAEKLGYEVVPAKRTGSHLDRLFTLFKIPKAHMAGSTPTLVISETPTLNK